MLCNFANTYLGDTAVSEDMVQEIFVYLWENRKTLSIQGSIKSYLFQSVKHKCLNELKHLKVKERHRSYIHQSEWHDKDVHLLFETAEIREIIQQKIEQMPAKRREVYQKSRVEGLTYQQIAQELNLSIKTVENHMGLALQYLRKELKHLIMVLIILLIK